jgi:hypothetical protein
MLPLLPRHRVSHSGHEQSVPPITLSNLRLNMGEFEGTPKGECAEMMGYPSN